MSADALEVDSSALDLALGRTISESKRFPQEVIKEAAKGVIRRAIGITPPASITAAGESAWNVVLGGAAKMQGERALTADIASIYGTPGAAFDLVKHAVSEPAAKGFYRHVKRGEVAQANAILAGAGGRQLKPFDGGVLAKNIGRNRRKRKKQDYVYFISNPEELKAFIAKKKANVGWLAAGWGVAAAALGVSGPRWITRHGAPGSIRVETTEFGITLTLVNSVRFAGEVQGWQRRINYAMREQADAMTRRSVQFMAASMLRAGLVLT